MSIQEAEYAEMQQEEKMKTMLKKRLGRSDVLTIPNGLSLFRLLLIPFIVHAYCVYHSTLWTVALIALSGLTDVADGYIARHFNMVSDLGKVLDPIADKLTQAAMVICLLERTHWMALLLGLLALREVALAVWGLVALQRTDTINCSKWHGKLCTGVVYASMITLILFPQIPDGVVKLVVLLCSALVVLTGSLYGLFYWRLLRGEKED